MSQPIVSHRNRTIAFLSIPLFTASISCFSAIPAKSQETGAITPTATITVTVQTTKNRHQINPFIYGSAYADEAAIRDLRLPLHRMGGNNTSRYNWQLNADNRGNDWYFQSIGDDSPVAGERGDTFITRSRNNKAEPMITIPLVGYVAKLNTNRNKLWSYSIAKYGAQTGADTQWNPDSGNGIRKSDNKPITTNDPLDANVAAGTDFQKLWVQHIVGKFGKGTATNGLRYYILDNEPGIWHATHRDVHPVGAKMEEVRDKSVAMAKAIKSLDANAIIVGPEEWGWTGYLYSGYDSQWGSEHGWSSFPDKAAHGNKDFVAWYLSEMSAAGTAANRRLLNVFSLHFYPQGGEFGNDTSNAMQERRNRSTRALFDPTYKDETWINDTVRLIPRMKDWVSQNYPGTQIGITEYNWGAENHINGATAQADIYGIFGREGVDIGTRWTTPANGTPTYSAMKLFRNYDGNGLGFGDTSVLVTTDSTYETLTTYAAIRQTDGAATVLLVSKGISTQPGTRNVSVNLASFAPGATAQVWQITSANSGAIKHLADIPVTNKIATLSVPTPSVTLLVVPKKL